MNFEKYSAKGNEFINALAKELGDSKDRERAGRVLRAVLHTLRDRISPDESLHLISQLPMYVKAIYVDGWNIKYSKSGQKNTLKDFIADLREKSGKLAEIDFGTVEEAEKAIKAVSKVMRQYVSKGEMDDVRAMLSDQLKHLLDGSIDM
ncbi:MAG: DUF2267 domain-containing protein [Chitinophagaceae bacterium]|nr:MAG: DUF2267 domain-containing protein [Chitinophagaceae bacterium]